MNPVQSSIEEALDAFADEIEAAWAVRSDAEKELRLRQVARSTTPPTDIDRAKLRRILERAAVSGSVEPFDLTAGLDIQRPEEAFDVLVRSFDRKLTGERWRWTLRSMARTPILLRLRSEGRLADVVNEVATIPTDVAGTRLRDLLSGRGSPASELDLSELTRDQALAIQEELIEWAQALEWLKNVAEFVSSRSRVERHLALTQAFLNGDRLLARGFAGRERELNTLADFIFASPSSPSVRLPLIELEGLGGSGKSTLLAKLERTCARRIAEGGVVLIHLDMDRISLQLGGELELTFEVTRQIGLRHPAAADQLEALRAQARTGRTALAEESSDAAEVAASRQVTAADFQLQAASVVIEHGLERRPVVLILDTYEEWQRGEAAAAGRSEREGGIADWLKGLRNRMRLRGLRVIVSGRAPAGPDDSAIEHFKPISLKPLRMADRIRLLAHYQLERDVARRAARLAGGNPLSLHLAARHLEHMDPEEREQFLGADPQLQGVRESVRQGVLYDRFLAHVRDEQARALAHPGLALRYVTVELISQVLAEPCGLGTVDADRAQELFDLLAEEVWLVERSGDRLHHRPDIRRSMLQMMEHDPRLSAAVEQVHHRAAEWYHQKTGPEAEVGARYHELMLSGRGANLRELDAPQIWARSYTPPPYLQILAQNAADLPKRLAIQLKFLVEKRVAASGLKHFPPHVRPLIIDRVGSELVLVGRPEAALDLLPMIRGSEPLWLSEARVSSGRWDEIIPALGPLRHDGIYAEEQPHAGAKYHLIDGFLTDSDERTGRAREFATRLLTNPRRSVVGPELLETLYFFRALAPDPETADREAFGILRGWGTVDLKLHPTAWIRFLSASAFAAVPIALFPSERPAPPEIAAALFRPRPDLIRRIGAADKRREQEILDFASMLEQQPLTSAELLRELPRRLQTVLGPRLSAEVIARAFESMGNLPDLLELRPAIRRALLHAYPTPKDVVQAVGAVLPLLPVKPTDFAHDQVARASQSDPQDVRTRLVEYVDRAGLMTEALDLLVQLRPGAGLLGRVAEGRRRLAAACVSFEARIRT